MNSKLALVRLANLVKDNEKLVQKLVKIINEDLDDYYLLKEMNELIVGEEYAENEN